MTKEQEGAIKYLEKQINYFKEQIKFIEAVDCGYYDEEYKLYKNRVKQFETVLNMLKEKDAEIEKYKQLYNKALDDAVTTSHDNMKKDKMIDLMAEELQKHIFVLYDGDTITSKKGIIQHYERKVEDD